MQRKVSVVVPAYNEADCIDELAARLRAVFDEEDEYLWEAVIVENGSTDDTWTKLLEIRALDDRFKLLRLARNFQMDGGLTAGLSYVSGDACVLMSADLQDPPELIPEFLRCWETGYQNVYGVVTERVGTGPIRTMNSRLFYWLADKFTGGTIPPNASDFRLLDRKAYEAVRSMEERNRFVRGLVAWVGFESTGVPFERPPRFAGTSKAYTRDVVNLAFKGILAYSNKPLRIIAIAGLAVTFLSLLALAISAFFWISRGVPFAGFGSLIALILLLFGFLALMLGVIGEYVGLIFEEVKGRPNFVVARWIE